MDDVLPSVARAADLTAQEQRLWSTDPAYAAAHAQALVTAAAGSLPATMTLLSDAGVRIVDDDSKKVILDARGPQRLQTQINAGQVRAFHGLLAKQGTFSLTDLMDLASAATGTSGQVPVRYVAAGIEADLTDPTRHPVWAALVRGSGAHDLLPALHTVAQGGHVQSEHVEMTSTQLFMLALRMRAEFAATLRIVAKMKHPPATPSPGPHAAPLAPQTSGSTHRGVSPPHF